MSEEGRKDYSRFEDLAKDSPYIKGEERNIYNSLLITKKETTDNAKTDKEDFDLTQIPFSSLKRLGKIFREGEVKYGKDNWRNGAGNKEYQLERANHALKHLFIYIERLKSSVSKNKDDEDDLAKTMWFCVTQIELEEVEKKAE